MKPNRLAIGACLLLVAGAALAAIATANWTNATQQHDEAGNLSPIPATGPDALVSTTVEWSQCGPGDTFTTKAGDVTVAASVNNLQTPNLAPGRWCFQAYHSNSYGPGDITTPAIVKVVTPPKPQAPGNFSVD